MPRSPMSMKLASLFGKTADRGFNRDDSDYLNTESSARALGQRRFDRPEGGLGSVAMPGMVRGADISRGNNYQAAMAAGLSGVGSGASQLRSRQMLQERAAYVQSKLRERASYEEALRQSQQSGTKMATAMGRKFAGMAEDYAYDNPPEGWWSMPDGRWVRGPTATPDGSRADIWGADSAPLKIKSGGTSQSIWGA